MATGVHENIVVGGETLGNDDVRLLIVFHLAAMYSWEHGALPDYLPKCEGWVLRLAPARALDLIDYLEIDRSCEDLRTGKVGDIRSLIPLTFSTSSHLDLALYMSRFPVFMQ
jgi:hypothetical protein